MQANDGDGNARAVYLVERSNRRGKKYQVLTPSGKIIHFGAADSLDYTDHGDPIKRALYLARHRSVGNWNDIKTPAFWSRWFSWQWPSKEEAADYLSQRLGVLVINNAD